MVHEDESAHLYKKVKTVGPNLQEIIKCGEDYLFKFSYEPGNSAFCFVFFMNSLLKETWYSLYIIGGEVLVSDPHHRCWRWKSPLCEV